MKNDRLFAIVYLLMNRGKMTASQLAKEMEVSRRTIHRDVDTLCQAGIPLYTEQGKNGGIALMGDFVFDRSLLSKEDQEQIVTALQSLRISQATGKEGQLLSKLVKLFGTPQIPWIDVDVMGWSRSRRDTFEALKSAILLKHMVRFFYYGRERAGGERTVEPIQLWFKEKNWYLRAFCLNRQDFRTFKLSRMRNLRTLNETFEQRAFELEPSMGAEEERAKHDPIRMHMDASLAYRVMDEFDEHEIHQNEDGSFLITLDYQADDWMYGMLLSFGWQARVLEPKYVQMEMQKRLMMALERYS